MKRPDRQKDRQIDKDMPRGTYRVANGASVLGEGNSDSDSAHTERVTPLQTKIKQQLSAEDAGINPEREASTRKKRAAQQVKPI